MSKLMPRYTTWEAINAALSVGMRALEEIRTLSRTPGKQGEPGKDGAPGKFPLVRAWTDAVHYQCDVVAHQGSTYQAQRDTAREPPHQDWICLAGKGRDGLDGRTPSIRGTWLATNEYRLLDIVILNGASFVAKRDEPGPCPGEDWQLMASQGKQGKPGDRGLPGVRGDRGEPGRTISAEVDGEGLLTLRNADGTTATCDLYPLLSKIGGR